MLYGAPSGLPAVSPDRWGDIGCHRWWRSAPGVGDWARRSARTDPTHLGGGVVAKGNEKPTIWLFDQRTPKAIAKGGAGRPDGGREGMQTSTMQSPERAWGCQQRHPHSEPAPPPGSFPSKEAQKCPVIQSPSRKNPTRPMSTRTAPRSRPSSPTISTSPVRSTTASTARPISSAAGRTARRSRLPNTCTWRRTAITSSSPMKAHGTGGTTLPQHRDPHRSRRQDRRGRGLFRLDHPPRGEGWRLRRWLSARTACGSTGYAAADCDR